MDLKEYEKIPKVTFIMRALCFIYNAILYMIRDFDDEILYVFVFIGDNDKIWLDIQKKKNCYSENVRNYEQSLY